MFWNSDDQAKARKLQEAARIKRIREDEGKRVAREKEKRHKIAKKKKDDEKRALIETEMERLMQGNAKKDQEMKAKPSVGLLNGALGGSFEGGGGATQNRNAGVLSLGGLSAERTGFPTQDKKGDNSGQGGGAPPRLNRPW